jgi:osmotically-inducible protein OsmY
VDRSSDIRQLVRNELEFDPLIDAVDISVSSIGGEVSLRGAVPTFPQYLEAGAAARRVDGVRNLHNHLEVVLRHCDRRNDAELGAAAEQALALDVTVPDGVVASAKNGELTLHGVVQLAGQRQAAADAIGNLTGIREVRNRVEVATAVDARDVTIRVQDALDRYLLASDHRYLVIDADKNILSLIGRVRSWSEHDAVIDAAWRAHGVHHVHDDLIIAG